MDICIHLTQSVYSAWHAKLSFVKDPICSVLILVHMWLEESRCWECRVKHIDGRWLPTLKSGISWGLAEGLSRENIILVGGRAWLWRYSFCWWLFGSFSPVREEVPIIIVVAWKSPKNLRKKTGWTELDIGGRTKTILTPTLLRSVRIFIGIL